MLPLVRLYVRTALAWLVVALTLGAAEAAAGVLGGPPWLRAMGPTRWHLLAVGWLNQLIWGVAHWMFPSASRDRPRGNLRLAAAAYVLLNVGLVLRLLAEPMLALGSAGPWRALLLGSAVAQWLAAVAFVAHILPRVRGHVRGGGR